MISNLKSAIGFVGATVLCVAVCSSLLPAQQAAASGPPLEVRTTNLPRAYLRQHYQTKLEASGGIAPLRWDATGGTLPPGTTLTPDGVIAGAPTETGEFHFVVTVTDGGKPPVQRNQPLVITVVAPLLAQWGKYPKVNGQRIEGTIMVSNQTEYEFDLTTVVMAVAADGRATAIGYQHFPLKKDVQQEIPFGENLPYGPYDLNADVVAEVTSIQGIFRARLVPKEKFVIQQEP